MPAVEKGKMGCKVVGRVRIEGGVLGDISVGWFPVADPGARDGLAEVDSFLDPGDGRGKGGSDGIVVNAG